LDHEREVALSVIRLLILAVEGLQIDNWCEALVLSLLEVLRHGLDRGGEAISYWFETDKDSLPCAWVNFDCLCHFGV